MTPTMSPNDMKVSVSEYNRVVRVNMELLEAIEKATRYITSLKGKEFSVQNSDYFSILVTLNEASKLSEGK